jgi:hypothetical protein
VGLVRAADGLRTRRVRALAGGKRQSNIRAVVVLTDTIEGRPR